MQNLTEPTFENTRRLESLYKYLNYEISSSVLYVGGWFYFMLLIVIIFAAIVFTPFMLYVLYKEEKKGWIISFSIIVLLPLIPISLFYPDLLLIGLAPFYLFCFLLRMEVKGWLTEMRARNDLILQKLKKENEGTELEDWLVMK
ncbi:MAG: hypothetical protein KKF62_03740 [Bacteroidetes bacterium]|nr:hypothetical protein [Bacteroidota bacterium]MBU1117173.1 hypothetical protein [Bacteroidota bacterium]MBU1798555.1 hypothetical protein [Bacteroidota bacterium]